MSDITLPGPRFSLYVLSPDRRYIAGRDVLDDAIILARTAAGKSHIEIWDNKIQRQCYVNEFGKERYARGYEHTPSSAITPRL